MLPSKIAFIIGEIKVEVEAHDELSGIKCVEFYLDGELQKREEEEPYTYDLKANGLHTITVKAIDNAGNQNEIERIIWILSL